MLVRLSFQSVGERGPYGDSATGEADADCAPAGNNTSSGSDGDETSDHALDSTDDGGLLEIDHIADCPAEKRHGGCDVGVEDSGACVCGSGVWITSVETVPADPEDTCTDQNAENVVWARVFPVSCQAGTDPVGAYETGCS